MNKKILASLVSALALAASGASWAADAPGYKTTFVPLGQGEPGVLYEPASPGAKASIAFFVMHASGDYLTFSACSELSKRGYRVLCVNNTTSKSGAFDDGILDEGLLQSKKAVAYLRSLPDVKKVLVFGHSGGATVMTAYQAIAESGLAFCQDNAKIHKCPDSLAGLPAADGVVLADSNWGQSAMVLLSIDPSVKDEKNGHTSDPALDMYNPANGYVAAGSHYSQDFIRKYQAAEAGRAMTILKTAQDRLALIDSGKGDFDGDEIFFIPGAFVAANKLFPSDTSLLSHSVKAWPLVHKDGSVSTQIIHSVRVPGGGPMGALTSNLYRAALKTTVKNYLASYAIRVTPDFGYGEDSTIRGVDWSSTYSSPPGNVEGISVPFLALGMTGNWEGLAAETIYDHAKSADKSLAFIEGATHIYTPCKACEKTPGEFGDTVKTTYDYIDGWVSSPGRFLAAPAKP